MRKGGEARGGRAKAAAAACLLVAGLALGWLYRASYRRYLARLGPVEAESLMGSRELRERHPGLFRSLGSLPAPKPGYPGKFSLQKPPGVIRIGAFGSSVTYGAEVASRLDFPYLLGELFRREGFSNVEVLNFGGPWYSFHQAVRFWEKCGRDYGLDFILLGPSSIQWFRDDTFNHTNGHNPGYVHGRYILRGRDAVWLEPVGTEDVDARAKAYVRFFPPWTYLRYDSRPPPFLQSLRPRDLQMRNPFYYLRGRAAREEKDRISKALLSRMDLSGAQVVMLYDGEELKETGDVFPKTMTVEGAPDPQSFPYRRSGHRSAFGNELVARAYFDLLTGRPSTRLETLEFQALPGGPARGAPAPLDRFSGAELRIGGLKVGAFIEARPVGFDEKVTNFRDGRIAALFALWGPSNGPLDLLFAPLDFPLAPGDRARLHWQEPGLAPQSADLGELAFFEPGVAMAYLPFPAVESKFAYDPSRRTFGYRLAVDPESLARLPGAAGPSASSERAWISIGDRPVYELEGKGSASRLRPLIGRHVYARPLPDSYGPLDRLGERGKVELALTGEGAKRVPFLRWARKSAVLRYHPGSVRRRIERSSAASGRAAIRDVDP